MVNGIATHPGSPPTFLLPQAGSQYLKEMGTPSTKRHTSGREARDLQELGQEALEERYHDLLLAAAHRPHLSVCTSVGRETRRDTGVIAWRTRLDGAGGTEEKVEDGFRG